MKFHHFVNYSQRVGLMYKSRHLSFNAYLSESVFASVAKRSVSQIVSKRYSLGQVNIKPQL